MKINRNKGNLQSQLAKMLQAGMENVESEPSTENQRVNNASLHATEQSNNNKNNIEQPSQQEVENENNINNQEQQKEEVAVQQPAQQPAPEPEPQPAAQPAVQPAARPVARQPRRATSKQSSRTTSTRSRRSRQPEPEMPRLNAAQRHEVPDHNAKYAGEPIKSVGCRMPQSLYARMLQYKAMNDSQLNRITLNDIIIEAVEKFMDENQ